ncbi:MAG TPA: metallophosphoesterase [Syntrophales bacterium]|nr:metallophosphoesterase [Syntrophales bacterium]HPQ43532.1 metallophosphoesterase [Syntrophales bacterium]
MMAIHPRIKKICVLALVIFLLFAASCICKAARSGEYCAPWKFAVISDTQGDNRKQEYKTCINDAVVRAIADDLVREKPDLVLVAGDLVNGWFRNGGTDYDRQYANWKNVMIPVYRTGIRVYPIRGNHDSGPERLALPPLPAHLEPPPDTVVRLKETFRKHFTETYIPKNGPLGEEGLTYSFTHKNAFFVGLDQYTDGQHRVNQDWIEGQLAGNQSPHVFVYGHEPAFETNHRDNLSFYPKERDAFWNAIGRAGGRVYFCGHDHFYNRALIRDDAGHSIYQIIAGTGGGVLRKWSGRYRDERVQGEYHNGDHHGYILVTVDGTKATFTWRALTRSQREDVWQSLDTFTCERLD